MIRTLVSKSGGGPPHSRTLSRQLELVSEIKQVAEGGPLSD